MKIRLCKLALAVAVLLSLLPVLGLDQAAAASPCDPYPQVCRYKFIQGCCVADPRFDCFDVCP